MVLLLEVLKLSLKKKLEFLLIINILIGKIKEQLKKLIIQNLQIF